MTDSWTVSLVDYNNDNWDDIFISDRDKTKSNHLFRNNRNKSFTKITTGDFGTDVAISISSSWADIDNDGDLDALVVNNTEKPNGLYFNNGNGTFTKKKSAGFLQQPAYYHNANWVDYDKDGLIDLFLCNYWPTKFNELWHNDGNGNFSNVLKIKDGACYVNVLTGNLERWGDYSGSQRKYNKPGEVWMSGYYAYNISSLNKNKHGAWIAQLATDSNMVTSTPSTLSKNETPTLIFPNPTEETFNIDIHLSQPEYLSFEL